MKLSHYPLTDKRSTMVRLALRLLWFLLVPILGFMFYVPHEIAFSIRDGWSGPEQNLISVFIGVCFCVAVDRFRDRRRDQRERQRLKR